jgi:hypothetical protein
MGSGGGEKNCTQNFDEEYEEEVFEDLDLNDL